MPPKQEGSYFYDIKKLNLVFAISAALFMGMVIWTILDDAHREWKHWQKEFNRLQFQKAKSDLAEAKKKVDVARLKEFAALLKKAKKEAKARKDEVFQVEKNARQAANRLTVINSEYQILKSEYDAAKYRYEEAAVKDPDRSGKAKAEMEDYGRRVAQYQAQLREQEKAKDQADGALAKVREQEQTARDQIKAQLKEMQAIKKKLKKLRPSLINVLRDIPLLDFMAPNLRIAQILPEGLEDDYNFVKVPKVDRCTTCHLGSDKPGFEDLPQPFTTHPQLERYLGASSAHPMEKFGCTSCHLGNGRGTSFNTAAHTPRGPAQVQEWKKKYHWHPDKHWSWPMLSTTHVQASCVSCHTNVLEVSGADNLSKARNLFADLGCVGCHATEGFNDLRKVGPTLTHLAGKVQRPWLLKWIKNPKSFNSHTRMPRFFGLSNDPANDRQRAMVVSIGSYLLEKSTPEPLLTVEATGDAERGKDLVQKVGCVACHAIGDTRASDFGPDLNGSGSKLSADWIFTWIKDPKKLYPETRMPSLRLSDTESADITAYLLTLKNPAFEELPVPQMREESLNNLAMEFLSKKFVPSEAQAELSKMNPKQTELFVGEQTILNLGCFGCHDIEGFKDTKKIGTELTEEGSKLVERFDFGFAPIEHTRKAFFRQKLSDPRAFDQGKVKKDQEKLKMPKFDLTPEQVELLTLHLMSLTKNTVPPSRRRVLNQEEQLTEQGMRLMHQFNCRGCHVLGGTGGDIAQTLQDKGYAPPALEGEGDKVKGDWLFTFLKKPSTIRPWLHIRMPTFGFSDEQATQLTRFFQVRDRAPETYRSLEKKELDRELWTVGKEMFTKFQCLQCHQMAEGSQKAAADLAPDLNLAAERLREDWIVEWLKDPQVIQEGTRMPTFFPEGQSPLPQILDGDVAKQIEALKEYVIHYKMEK